MRMSCSHCNEQPSKAVSGRLGLVSTENPGRRGYLGLIRGFKEGSAPIREH